MREHTAVLPLTIVLLIAVAAPAAIENGPATPKPPESATAVPQSAEVASELQKAAESFQQGRFDECLSFLQSATTKQPSLSPARVILARFFFAANRVQECRVQLENAAVEHPQHPEVYLTFGNLALLEGRLTDAGLHYEKAAAANRPDDWTDEQKRILQVRLADGQASVAERRSDWKTAGAKLADWLALEPDSGMAHQRLATVLFQTGQVEEAHEHLQQAERHDKSIGPAALLMAMLFDQKGDAKSTEKWMTKAVENNPDSAAVRVAYATWLLKQDRPEDAKPQAEAAVELAPEAREAKLLLGRVLRALGDYAAAITIFQSMYEKSPGDAEASNSLALALIELPTESDRRRALELAEVLARQYPKDPGALSTLAWIHFRLGRPQQAERLLKSAISSGQIRSDTAYYLARVLSQLERGAEAAEAKKLVANFVSSPGVFLLRSEARKWLESQEMTESPNEQSSQDSKPE